MSLDDRLRRQVTVRKLLFYALYDWTRKMPRGKRVATWAGLLIQGYAIYALATRSLVWPFLWPRGLALYVTAIVLYSVGYGLMNAMLTWEFFRKSALEAEQRGARLVQETLQPRTLEEIPGYRLEVFAKPFREVGGDYVDVVGLPGGRALLAIVDVSGKGMPAALLAANIQALVRSLADADPDPRVLADRTNRHLCRYTPTERFATAFLGLLDAASGELVYVNAGHNPPLLATGGSARLLEGTGFPLGLFQEAAYERGRAQLSPKSALLLYTDGLADGIPGASPEEVLGSALAQGAGLERLLELVDPALRADDVTALLVARP
jgi:serine phosphatase RsbU (regulator of sigma subunit)